MPQPRQHLAWAFDVAYLVTWADDGSDTLAATIQRADTDFRDTWADTPRTITLPRALVDDLGDVAIINQMLGQLAPARTGAVALACPSRAV